MRVERRSLGEGMAYSSLLRFFWLGDASSAEPSELEVGISAAAL
jgi:hypothetical protein